MTGTCFIGYITLHPYVNDASYYSLYIPGWALHYIFAANQSAYSTTQ